MIILNPEAVRLRSRTKISNGVALTAHEWLREMVATGMTATNEDAATLIYDHEEISKRWYGRNKGEQA